MSSLHITVGIPASGKSTWARQWVAEDREHRFRVNRDDIRTLLGLKHGEDEKTVSTIQQQTVRNLLQDGFDVVVDDTNLVPKFAKEWLKIAQRYGAEVVWHEEFLKVDPRVCNDRDMMREEQVGWDVIAKMAARAKNWKRPKLSEVPDLSGFKPYHGTPGKPKAFLVDIDGTIASNGDSRDNPNRGWFDWHRVGEDKPIQAILDIVRHFEMRGLTPIFVSGRDEVCRRETLNWIFTHYHDLVMSNETLDALTKADQFDIYPHLIMRPEGDNRKDSIIKLELFDRYIRDNFDVQFALDDRDQVVKAYREVLGLTVLQVAPGDF